MLTAVASVVAIGVVTEMLEVGHQGDDAKQAADDTEGQKRKRDHARSIRVSEEKGNSRHVIF